MMFEAFVLLLAAAPVTDGPPARQPELASDNVIADAKRALVSFECNTNAVKFQLRWPLPFEGTSVDVGVGSGGEMDAAMGPSKTWTTLAQADHQVITPPFPGAEIVAAAGDDEYLLFMVKAPGASETAQFETAAIKALFKEAVERCNLTDKREP